MDECLAKTGKPPISTRWVDVDKGRNGIVDIRSRLVARDFKIRGDGREFEVFFRMAVLDGSVHGGEEKGKVKLMFLDVKKAHLNGIVKDDEFAYIELPETVAVRDAAGGECLGEGAL